MTAAGRLRREAVRTQELFEQEVEPPEVARRLRVSLESAYQRRQLRREGGAEASASRRPGSAESRAAGLELKPAAHCTRPPAGPAGLSWPISGADGLRVVEEL